MIIRGGENIYPWEIEQVLADHPDVADAAVVGVPDDYWGAAGRRRGPAAFAGHRQRPGQLLPDRLAPHTVPKIWSRVDTLPMTGSGKIMKHVLRERLSRELPRPSAPGPVQTARWLVQAVALRQEADQATLSPGI